MSRFAVTFVILGLIATYGLWAVVAMLIAIILWLGVALYAAHDIAEEIAADLAQARQELEDARGRVQALQRARPAPRHSRGEGLSRMQRLYARVGLAEGCSEFVLEAVQKAHRKALHPDLQPAHNKAEAESQFKDMESVFDVHAAGDGALGGP